jgi:NAD+ synthase
MQSKTPGKLDIRDLGEGHVVPDLKIDADKAIDAICRDIARRIEREGTDGVVLGLSGGLDSSVLAALAAKAVGPDRVTAIYLCDQDSDRAIAANAELMAKHLNLELEVTDISGEMEKRDVYRPLFIKLLRLSPVVAKVSAGGYRLVCGETVFKTTLRVGRGEKLRPWYKKLLYGMTMHHVDAGFSKRHQFRRTILEQVARARNLSLIGAANMSECEVGWFVKDGIDDIPCQPMAGLYKTQVRQLARRLELPDPVCTQLPSPDMAKGVSDEFGIGHDYTEVDIVIDGFDKGLADKDIAALGIPQKDIDDIRDLMELSDWKRQSPHEDPPVSGKFGSGLRKGTDQDRGSAPSRCDVGKTTVAASAI